MSHKITRNRNDNLIAGAVVIAAIATWCFNFAQQASRVINLCSAYPVGSSTSNMLQYAKTNSIKLRGPSVDAQGQNTYIACADYSMCDIACTITAQGQIVTPAICDNCGLSP